MNSVLWLAGLTTRDGEPVVEAQFAADELVRLRQAGDLLERVTANYLDGTGTFDDMVVGVDMWRSARDFNRSVQIGIESSDV